MKTRNLSTYVAIGMILVAELLSVRHSGAAVSNADYTATPPFVSNTTTPNIILVMDNSGSMSGLACDNSNPADGDCRDAGDRSFDSGLSFSGYFDSLRCYTYDTGTDERFEPATAKTTLSTACPTSEWDGNFLNWATFRRFDAVKKAMIGGDCTVSRATDGTCPANGSPALKTVRAQANGVNTELVDVDYAGGTGATTYVGRIPSADRSGNPATLWIGTDSAYFCIDNDSTFNSNCGDGYSERKYQLKVGQATEPNGVIQQIGNKARFGLFEFKSSSQGARMLVGVGSRQSIDWSDNDVETFDTNTAAMVDAVQESFPSTWTPLAESLYEAVRYVAQINSANTTGSYVYPISFSGGNSNGVNFQANGVGSIGANEISALGAGESCPSGYIASACGRDPYFFGKNHTPAWASTSQVVNCCRTFVILFTDGEPTEDQGVPNALQDYAHALHGVHCTGNDTNAPPRPINGTCNANITTPFSELLAEHKTDYADNGSHYLDEVAYWAHTNDMRPCSGTGNGTLAVLNVTGHCLPGNQNVTVYSFFAFGNINGRGILAQTARLGGFEDANADGIPQTGEWDKENNYTGAATPDGIPDAYFESSNVDDLQDKMLATIASILRRSSSGSSVSVLATASTGEGALYQSYFYPTTTETATGNDVRWIGYTQSLFIDTFGNLREDTDGNAKLDYKNDKIVKTRVDTGSVVRVDKYVDANGDGLPDDRNSDGLVKYPEDCNPCDQTLSDMSPIWEAGKQLALKDAATRTILTWVDSDHDGVVDAGEQIPFTTANSSTLYPYLRAANTTAADKIINFVRGCERAVCTEQATTRDRRLQVPPLSGTLKVWKLGDVIHSTPTVVAGPKDRYDVKYGDASYGAFLLQYYNRRQVAYVGGNDGMLHAFNAGYYHVGDDPSTGTASLPVIEHGYFTTTPTGNPTGVPQLGEELWGFVPYELLPQLEFLTRSDYQHAYYVDLPLKVADVRIFTPDADHPNGWGTILIGGFRLGGSCGACAAGTGAPPMIVNIGGTNYNFYSAYFALDVTNPEVQPKLLWSFSDPALGLTTSVPAVVRVNPDNDTVSNTNAKWYMVAGSGMTGYGGNVSQSAKVFVVNLQTGPGANNALMSPPFTVGSWDSFLGDMVTVDKNLDYRHDAIYFGRVIDDGTPPWRGKLYRLTTAQSAPFGFATSPSAWGIASGSDRVPTEILDTFPSGASPAYEMGPITAAPGLSVDDGGNLWVFAGSGRYYSNSDKADLSIQYFVGVKDSVLNTNCNQASGATSCMDNDLVDMSNTKICVVGVGNCGASGGTNQVTGGPSGVTTFSDLVGHIQSKDGWFVRLVEPANPPGQPTPYGIGERVVNPPTIFGGIVFFPTFTPTNDICASSGTSKLFALFYKTGSAYQEPIIGSSGSGTNQNVNASISIGSGLAFGAVAHTGSGSDGGSPFQLLINNSQGNFACGGCDGNDPTDPTKPPTPGTPVGVAIDPRSSYLSWINM